MLVWCFLVFVVVALWLAFCLLEIKKKKKKGISNIAQKSVILYEWESLPIHNCDGDCEGGK